MRKHFHQIAIGLSLIVFSCSSSQNDSSLRFSSNEDTLVIQTITHKGPGKFERIFTPLRFQEISEQFSYPVILPTNVTDIKRTFKVVDFKAYWYTLNKEDQNSELPSFLLDAILYKKLDTTQVPTRKQNQIDLITGIRDSMQVFVVDENNNQDLTDDPVRNYQPVNWNSSENFINSEFHIFNGEKIVKDSSWVKVGTLGSNPMLFLGVAEYVTADFFLDDQYYQIGIADYQTGYTYQNPTFVLLKKNSDSKDTLFFKDTLYPNEFIRLNNEYYQFYRVSNNGDYVTLIKENEFDTKVGTQVGIKAPDFTAITTSGDTIKSSYLHDKPLIIANSCGCGGDIKSTAAYNDIKNKYGENAYILHLDSNISDIVEEVEGIHIDMEEEFNAQIYDHFRKTYCSRVCYVINISNTVVDKFFIKDWQEALSKFEPFREIGI